MPPQLGALENMFANAVSSIIALAGIALFVLLVSGGLKLMNAGADSRAAEGAKSTITYAIGGLVLILVAYLILVIIKTITGANITQFKVTL